MSLISSYIAATPVPTNGSQCVVTLDAFKAVHGKEPADGMDTFGWRELDGLVKNFPTDDSEKVSYGDSVAVYDEVYINPCYSWCVHTQTHTHTHTHIQADVHQSINQSKRIYIAPYVAGESEARVGLG